MSANYEHHEEATTTYEEGAIKVQAVSTRGENVVTITIAGQVHATIKEPEELKELISSLYTAGDQVGF